MTTTSHGHGDFTLRAETFDEYTKWLRNSQLLKEMRGAMEGLGCDGPCLDLCGGTGRFSIEDRLSTQRRWVVIDSSEAMLRQAGDDGPPRSLALAERLPIRSGSISLVLIRSALEYVDVDLVMSEVRRVLSSEGRLVVVQKTADRYADHIGWLRRMQRLRSPDKREPWSSDDLRQMLDRAGFRILGDQRVDTKDDYDVETWVGRAGTIPEGRSRSISAMIDPVPDDLREDTGFEVVGNRVRTATSWQIVTSALAEPRPRLIPLVAAAIVEQVDAWGVPQILLQRRRSEPEYWQWWELPQGHVRAGESVEHAAERELREETGLRGEARSTIGSAFGPVGGRRAVESSLLDALGDGRSEFVAVGVHVDLVDAEDSSPDTMRSYSWLSRDRVDELLRSERDIFPLDAPLLERWVERSGSSNGDVRSDRRVS